MIICNGVLVDKMTFTIFSKTFESLRQFLTFPTMDCQSILSIVFSRPYFVYAYCGNIRMVPTLGLRTLEDP